MRYWKADLCNEIKNAGLEKFQPARVFGKSLIPLIKHAQDVEYGVDFGDAEMSDFPGSLREFETCFPDDESCARWLAKVRWPDGFVCPACGHGKGFELERGVLTYRCAGCRKQTSVTTGLSLIHI